MKNNVFLVCMLLFSISVFGQELKIQGHLIDEEKQDLVAATIRCYLNDTLFVVGELRIVKENLNSNFHIRNKSTSY